MFFATLKGPGIVYIQSLPFSRLAARVLALAPQTGSKTRGEGSLLGGIGNLLDGDNRTLEEFVLIFEYLRRHNSRSFVSRHLRRSSGWRLGMLGCVRADRLLLDLLHQQLGHSCTHSLMMKWAYLPLVVESLKQVEGQSPARELSWPA